jgi:hypothetical protein
MLRLKRPRRSSDLLRLYFSGIAGIAHAERTETSMISRGLVPLLQYMGELMGEELPRLLAVRLVVCRQHNMVAHGVRPCVHGPG